METTKGQGLLNWRTVKLPGDLYRELRMRAACDDKSVAEFVREALEKSLAAAGVEQEARGTRP